MAGAIRTFNYHVKFASKRENSLSRIRSAPVWIRSSRLHWTSTGTDPNGYTFESDPNLVWIADPHRYRSSGSSVNGKPICTLIGTDPFGSVPV